MFKRKLVTSTYQPLVLIVGGSPTGLTASILLSHLGDVSQHLTSSPDVPASRASYGDSTRQARTSLPRPVRK
ncbi:MAG: hypothetical protein C5B60_05190 [Chloroflexi bacterium]|nr:MAG: hypothetical protein C5B60_05190 [Chloroflexota bacterium]